MAEENGHLQVEEVYINATEGYRLGDGDMYEPFTDDIGRLFRSMQQEHGRCVGKMYVEPDGRQIGWVFEKRRAYEDARTKANTYLQRVWVTLHEKKPTKTTEYHYKYLS